LKLKLETYSNSPILEWFRTRGNILSSMGRYNFLKKVKKKLVYLNNKLYIC